MKTGKKRPPPAAGLRENSKRINLLYGSLVVVMLGILVVFEFLDSSRAEKANDLVAKALEDRRKIERVFSIIKDGERGQKGYLLTGDAAFLIPFEYAQLNLEAEIDELRDSVKSPEMLLLVDQLAELVEGMLREFDQTLTLRRREGFEAAVAAVKRDMDYGRVRQIRETILKLLAGEESILRERVKEAESSSYIRPAILIVAFVTFLLLLKLSSLLQSNERVIRHLEIANGELSKAMDELEEFTYRLSHDLRSPLVSSIAIIRLAKEAIQKGDSASAIEGLTLGENALQKLETLVHDILTLAKVRLEEEQVMEINFEELVDASIDKFCKMDNFGRVEFRKLLSGPGILKSKLGRVTTILENLISNAIKYQDTDEALSFISISSRREGGDFVLTVEDNGLGIPEEYRGKVFEMFRRFHSKVSFGSGLGLYLTKQSALALGGDISFEQPGKGARFKLTLPIR